jgi:hypothetical protein
MWSNTERLSGNPEFHPALSEKKIAIPPPCLEVVRVFEALARGENLIFRCEMHSSVRIVCDRKGRQRQKAGVATRVI